MPPEVVELAEAEDPFGSFDYLPSAAINGKTVEYSRGARNTITPSAPKRRSFAAVNRPRGTS